jgi:hypothetical protein
MNELLLSQRKYADIKVALLTFMLIVALNFTELGEIINLENNPSLLK